MLSSSSSPLSSLSTKECPHALRSFRGECDDRSFRKVEHISFACCDLLTTCIFNFGNSFKNDFHLIISVGILQWCTRLEVVEAAGYWLLFISRGGHISQEVIIVGDQGRFEFILCFCIVCEFNGLHSVNTCILSRRKWYSVQPWLRYCLSREMLMFTSFGHFSRWCVMRK